MELNLFVKRSLPTSAFLLEN